ncbi:hypothetical protein D3C87_1516400 [compost metagenome]
MPKPAGARRHPAGSDPRTNACPHGSAAVAVAGRDNQAHRDQPGSPDRSTPARPSATGLAGQHAERTRPPGCRRHCRPRLSTCRWPSRRAARDGPSATERRAQRHRGQPEKETPGPGGNRRGRRCSRYGAPTGERSGRSHRAHPQPSPRHAGRGWRRVPRRWASIHAGVSRPIARPRRCAWLAPEPTDAGSP